MGSPSGYATVKMGQENIRMDKRIKKIEDDKGTEEIESYGVMTLSGSGSKMHMMEVFGQVYEGQGRS